MEEHYDYNGRFSEYYNAFMAEDKCPSAGAQLLRYIYGGSSLSYCPARFYYYQPTMAAEEHEKNSFETLTHVLHIFWTIVPTLIFFALARLAVNFVPKLKQSTSTLRFLLEFLIIALPIIVSVNIANKYVEYFVAFVCGCVVLLLWRTRCFAQASQRQFEFGKRPSLLTLLRVTISFLTVLCILAIDFESFPKDFRKTRRFGAGLMDVGIGLFVFSMGCVSRRLRRSSDIVRLLRVVAPALLLGLARTVVIMIIDYHQDEHEYGVHLNAFFTLGLTKLFGALLSAVVTADGQLLPLGVVILAIHEIVLQCGVSDYVMDKDLERNTFLAANREGLCSLPGFIGIYIISMYFGQWLQTKPTLSYKEFMRKLKTLTAVSISIWLIVLASIFAVGIARVTCNFGYTAWMFGIAVTMTTLFMFVFDLILNTLWPIDNNAMQSIAGDEYLLKSSHQTSNVKKFEIPTLVEAVNLNGLLYFLLANILTGGVNIFLKPEDRSDNESILILSLYLLITTGFVYTLYRLKIRIA